MKKFCPTCYAEMVGENVVVRGKATLCRTCDRSRRRDYNTKVASGPSFAERLAESQADHPLVILCREELAKRRKAA